MAGTLLSGAVSIGCGSSKTTTPNGVGGTGGIRPGTDGSAGGGGTSDASTGGAGLDGASTGGVGGRGTGGTATVGTGGMSTGGVGGTGGSGTGGLTSGPDAGSADARPSLDTGPSCRTITTQAACDQRSDCHSVSAQQSTCACSTPGCCMTFSGCDDGGTVSCDGTINCTSATPPCQAPYVAQYVQSRTSSGGAGAYVPWVNGCYDGCVLASKCGKTTTCPPAAPADGASCGGNELSCFYQDCNPSTTQANCQGGTWSVHTGNCSSISCTGAGTTAGTFLCRPGQICVQYRSAGGAYFVAASCLQDTCAPAPVSLQCIDGLDYPNCAVSSQTTIACSQSSGPGGVGGAAGPSGGAPGSGGNAGAGGVAGSVDGSATDGG